MNVQIRTSVNELGGPRGRAGREILTLDKPDAEATRDSVEGDAGASGATADYEDVKRISRVGTDQRRGLNRSGRNDGIGVVDPLPNCLEFRNSAAAVVGRERWLVENNCASGCGGEHGGAYAPAHSSC